jgi:hypothetical protein
MPMARGWLMSCSRPSEMRTSPLSCTTMELRTDDGQATPTSVKGFRGPSTPQGSIEEPLNPLTLALTAGATFVARGYR